MLKNIIPDKSIGFITKQVASELLKNESILYCLGIGFSHEQENAKDLEFTYELNANFKTFPTFATCFHKVDLFGLLRSCPGIPKFNAVNLLHGEQRLDIFRPIRPGMKIETIGKIANIEDKIKNAIINLQFDSYEINQNGEKELSFANTMVLVLRGFGGFSKYNPITIKGEALKPIQKYPNRAPDQITREKTNQNQAILYRLNGDPNPLHIDPNVSFMTGFKKPILHGLCTYGIAAKIAMQSFLDNNPELIRNVYCRFSSHVFPGETLEFKLWKNENAIYLSGSTIERGKEVIFGEIGLKEGLKI